MTSTAAVRPAWARDVSLSLPLHPQILLTGNVRDLYPIALPIIEGDERIKVDSIDLVAVLWHLCRERGYAALALLDGVTGKLVIRTASDAVIPEFLAKATEELFLKPAALGNLLVDHVSNDGAPVGLVIPYAAHIASAHRTLNSDDGRLLAQAEALGHRASPTPYQEGQSSKMTPYNTIFWVCGRQEDLHPSFAVDSPAIRVIPIPHPTLDVRTMAAGLLFQRQNGLTEKERERRARALAEVTHGMTVRDVLSCGRLARDRGLTEENYSDAARLLQIGLIDDPWSAGALRSKISSAEEYLNSRVLGQERAVAKAVDVMIRSAVGLNGAHTSSSPNRPRGVLFLAGPTGVGKTELAKGIASLVLGDGAEPVRFDMSEFRADEAHQRLIGAPPGYVGYDVGGELTNAVRANPVCVLLFDEIEKAHRRIFDLFLQILEDGRLTDGRGATVYFTECFLIFTSNLGVLEETADGNPIPARVAYEMKTGEVERLLREAFEDFFNHQLRRPEMRNRFGDSFVVLDYIRPHVGPLILAKALKAVADRVMRVHGVRMEITTDVLTVIGEAMSAKLSDGGRGIGTVVESLIVNPLSRAIFDKAPVPGATIQLTRLAETDGRWHLEVD